MNDEQKKKSQEALDRLAELDEEIEAEANNKKFKVSDGE